jgi:hypothetical protein
VKGGGLAVQSRLAEEITGCRLRIHRGAHPLAFLLELVCGDLSVLICVEVIEVRTV